MKKHFEYCFHTVSGGVVWSGHIRAKTIAKALAKIAKRYTPEGTSLRLRIEEVVVEWQILSADAGAASLTIEDFV